MPGPGADSERPSKGSAGAKLARSETVVLELAPKSANPLRSCGRRGFWAWGWGRRRREGNLGGEMVPCLPAKLGAPAGQLLPAVLPRPGGELWGAASGPPRTAMS